MSGMLIYYRTAERPDIRLWLLDDDGSLVPFGTGYTFVFKLGVRVGSAAALTKTVGITGADGAGVEPTGTPNVTLTFSDGELDSLAPGVYVWQLRATSSSLDRFYQGTFQLRDVLT